jgi:hypothetical protein
MSSPNIYSAGLNLAGTVFANGPATLQLDGATYLSGSVQWLDTISGNNVNAGSLPELPVATLAQAVTNSAANGVIVIGAGSSESLVGSQALSLAGLSIFGCGTGSSRPRYTCTGAVDMWSVGATGVWIEGIYFPASTAVATSRIKANSDGLTVKDCYFECGASDTNRALSFSGGNFCRADGCSFVVTASRPATGLEVVNSVTDTVIVDCVFDGGSYGWTSYALKVSNSATRVRLMGNTFSNRSDLGFTVTGASYQLFGNDMGGTSNVLLTA